MLDDLYSADLLALAADIPHLGRLAEPDGEGAARSMVCGSQVSATIALDREGRLADLGLEIEACAIGQASASVFARHALGATRLEVAAARDAFAAMLKEGGPPPQGRFAPLAALKPVAEYPRRHASALLVMDAALKAFDAAA